MIYAIANVGERDTPARQCTRTHPPASLTLSTIIHRFKAMEQVRLANTIHQLLTQDVTQLKVSFFRQYDDKTHQ